MTNKKLLMSIAAAGLTAGLTACDDSTSSTDDEGTTVTEASFKETCETAGGTLEEIATCAGANSCEGSSWHNGEVISHTCAGKNECNGWSCLDAMPEMSSSMPMSSSVVESSSSSEVAAVTEAAFKETCETSGGTLTENASCSGHSSCAGSSWSDGKVIDHNCAGLNECKGWSCAESA